jgi:hypothetical protein
MDGVALRNVNQKRRGGAAQSRLSLRSASDSSGGPRWRLGGETVFSVRA